MKLSSNKNSSVILLIVLVVALLFAVFYYIVFPKKDNIQSLEGSISSLQTEITALEGQMASLDETSSSDVSNIYAIRQKLPQSREIDQLLLNLEEIEYVTETRITSIGFNSYDALVSESAIAPVPEEATTVEENTVDEDTEATAEGEEIVEGEETGETVETPVSEIAAEIIPPELKLITFNLTIEASVYDNIQQFIQEIENLKRIMHIDSISYTLPGEEGEFLEEEAETLSASVQVTTFFYEGES
ncbi:type 4a pilus biogenesis protein PilO [Ureibacillus chungkukjangi]|uniref:type 4a pilus biogenesis protein PilO n=1 Tax=Ureibacillus chungkukjangi TaxID=1202712 RepID=UPI002041A7F2|nr:type 4a pilus biogenesis protein PilO [Ureibacillus chungkukjangi]MCM3386976.1 type 4a pilus biogenesis protein PilO [Ureibacillus chungkukjangi]